MAGEDADAASRIEEKIEDDSRGRLSSRYRWPMGGPTYKDVT